MRKTIASFVVAGMLAAAPCTARAQDTAGDEMLFSFLAAAANLFYTPAKLVVASTGMVLGGLAGALNGGDTRAQYAFLVPMTGGSYFLTSDQMAGRTPVEFFGSDYADRPSTYDRAHHESAAYNAMYVGR